MSRMMSSIDEWGNMATVDDLYELVPLYAFNKGEADSYKKVADNYNAAIKKIMSENELKSFTSENVTVTRVVSVKETLNEAMLLQVAKKYNLPIIKTIEVVDMDLLEDYLYRNNPSEALAEDLNKCKSSTEVVSIRLKEAKK